MGDTKVFFGGEHGPVPVRAYQFGDGSFALAAASPDLKKGTKSLTLTLSSGVGSVPIPDTCTVVGVKPAASTTVRVGLEAPEADGTATGAAAASALKKGLPVEAAIWTWLQIEPGTDRTLHLSGGSSDVIEVVVA